jgi:hypothetical protein
MKISLTAYTLLLATTIVYADRSDTLVENIKNAQNTSSNDIAIVQVSLGELIDKISILKIKELNIHDAEKLKHVKKELQNLEGSYQDVIIPSPELHELEHMLFETNQKMWQLEDDIRYLEQQKHFGEEFIELARLIFRSNDKRCQIKKHINELLGSGFHEVKQHPEY